MASILTHPAIPLAMALGAGRATVSGRLLAAGMVASVLPDADVIAFSLGVSYASIYGHRGLTHSFGFAALLGSLGIAAAARLEARRATSFWFLFLAAASHGVLDAMTNGGRGVALLWPLSGERFFLPFRPLEVSPISVSRFMSERGLEVLQSELLWIWLPCLLAAVVARLRVRR